MGKSEARNHMRANVFPEAFVPDGQVPYNLSECRVKAHDSLQLIKALSTSRIETGSDLVQAVARPAQFAFRGPFTTFIYSFDKYPFVPVAKSVEQGERDDTAQLDRQSFDDFKLEMNELIPENYQDALHDRSYACREIVRFACKNLLADPSGRLGVPFGRRVIIDGHYMKTEDVDFDKWFCDSCDVEGSICEHKQSVIDEPHMMQCVPICIENGGRITLCFQQTNTIGEGDFAMLWLIRQFCPNQPMAIESTDTDLVWIMLMYLRRFPETPVMLLQYWPSLSWCATGQMQYPYTQRWCDIKKLENCITADPKLSAVFTDPVACVIAAVVASGGDYTDTLRQVPHKYWVDAITKHPEFLKIKRITKNKDGEVVKEEYLEPVIDGVPQYDCIARLTRVACALRVRGKDGLSDARTELRKGTGSAYMPSSEDLQCRLLHIQFYFKMLEQVGQDKGVLLEPQPCEWGYGRRDTDKPLQRGNIRRLHDTVQRDAARLEPQYDTTRYGEWGSSVTESTNAEKDQTKDTEKEEDQKQDGDAGDQADDTGAQTTNDDVPGHEDRAAEQQKSKQQESAPEHLFCNADVPLERVRISLQIPNGGVHLYVPVDDETLDERVTDAIQGVIPLLMRSVSQIAGQKRKSTESEADAEQRPAKRCR